MTLPIHAVLPDLLAVLRERSGAVLVARTPRLGHAIASVDVAALVGQPVAS